MPAGAISRTQVEALHRYVQHAYNHPEGRDPWYYLAEVLYELRDILNQGE